MSNEPLTTLPEPFPAAPTSVIPPTPEEIDQAIIDFYSTKRMLQGAKDLMEEHKARLVFLVDSFGTAPAKAEQSKRLEGKLNTVTVTRGTSIGVDEGAVMILRDYLGETGHLHFERLFVPQTRHKMVEGANDFLRTVLLPKRIHQKVLALFGLCVKVDTNSPSVKVEMRKAEKPAKQKPSGKAAA